MLPWALRADMDTSVFGPSAPGREFVDIIRRFPGFGAGLASLRSTWSHDCVIHGDFKLSHALVGGTQESSPPIRIVDWEFATPGDCAWDVGGLLQSYLTIWVNSMQLTPGADPTRWMQTARAPIETMHSQIRAFFEQYVAERGQQAADRGAFLTRAVACSGARLIQSAFEQANEAGAITAQATTMLQLGLNVLTEPEFAQAELYAIH